MVLLILTVDGRNPANQLRLVVYPIIFIVLDVPGGVQDFFHQQQLQPIESIYWLYQWYIPFYNREILGWNGR